MYLSSRFAACVGIAAFFIAGTPAELTARPAFTGMRPTLVTPGPRVPTSGIAPTLVAPGHPNYAGYRGIRPTLVAPGRRGLRYGYGGGLGYDGYGIGDFGDAGYAQPGLGPIDAPPPFAYPPLPPRCPQIIEIGGGLAHKPATRVTYGAPCRR